MSPRNKRRLILQKVAKEHNALTMRGSCRVAIYRDNEGEFLSTRCLRPADFGTCG